MDATVPIDGWPPLRATGMISPGSHPPKQLFLTPDGQTVAAQFELGPGEHHQRLFIDYERTFGRGKAFAATHSPAPFAPPQQRAMLDRYTALANCAPYAMLLGTEEQVDGLCKELAAFRRDYPDLYDDVRRRAVKRTFVIHADGPT